jgi:membrane protein YdbS with pleckstrin-like domain
MAEENVVWSGNPSQVTNMGTFILWGLLALTMVLLPVSAIVILWKYLVVKNQKYELTTQRLKTHVGVLSKKIEEIELYRVKDTKFEQTFFLRLFNLGNVVLFSSDMSQPTETIYAVSNAQALREQIRNLVEARRDQKRVRNIESE